MHAISSYRGNRPTNTQTNPHTHTQTHRQDRLQYAAPLSLARSVIKIKENESDWQLSSLCGRRCTQTDVVTSDLFPPTAGTQPPLSAEQWLAGVDRDPTLVPLIVSKHVELLLLFLRSMLSHYCSGDWRGNRPLAF